MERIDFFSFFRTPANRSYQEETLGALPEGWEERVHSDGRIFYIDHSKQPVSVVQFWILNWMGLLFH